MERIANEIQNSMETGMSQNACLEAADRMLREVKTKRDAKEYVNFIFGKAGNTFDYSEKVQAGIFMYMTILYMKERRNEESCTTERLRTLCRTESQNIGQAEDGPIGKMISESGIDTDSPVLSLFAAWSVKDADERQRTARTAETVCAAIIDGDISEAPDEEFDVFTDEDDEQIPLPLDIVF